MASTSTLGDFRGSSKGLLGSTLSVLSGDFGGSSVTCFFEMSSFKSRKCLTYSFGLKVAVASPRALFFPGVVISSSCLKLIMLCSDWMLWTRSNALVIILDVSSSLALKLPRCLGTA